MNCSFTSLNLNNNLIESLSKIGIYEPSKIQYNFIKSSIDDSSIIFQSKSGTGKTVSFCISILQKIIDRINLQNEFNSCDSIDKIQYKSINNSLFGDVLIIVPTRELAYQIYIFFITLKKYLQIIKSILLIGTSNVLKIVNYMKNKNVNVVVSTPGRIKSILNSKPTKTEIDKYRIKTNAAFFKTHTLVFDEADLLLDDHFYEQTKHICLKLCNPFVQIMAVSATFQKPQLKKFEDMIYDVDNCYINRFLNSSSSITDDLIASDAILNNNISHLLLTKKIDNIIQIRDYLLTFERVFERMIISSSYVNRKVELKSEISDNESQILGSDEGLDYEMEFEGELPADTLVLDKVEFYNAVVDDAPNIVLQIGYKMEVLVKVLESVNYKKCIIFCNQSHTRAQAYSLLRYLGYTCYINSSRVSQTQRLRMLYDLNSIDSVIILSTDIMSRGIGLASVDLVINMDLPSSKEIFLHRSGRCARFGASGKCVSICMESEVDTYKYFKFSLNFKSNTVEALYKNEGFVDVSELLMNSIDFVNLENDVPDTRKIVKPSLIDSFLDTEECKFKVSIVGFISDAEIMLFNTSKAQPLMYLDSVDDGISVFIKEFEYGQVLYESSATEIIIMYLEDELMSPKCENGSKDDKICVNFSEDYKNNKCNSAIRHIIIKMGNHHLIISLPQIEFRKLCDCSSKLLKLLNLNDKEVNCELETVKSVDEKVINSDIGNHNFVNVKNSNCNKSLLYNTELKEAVMQMFKSKCSINYNDFKSILNVVNGLCNDDDISDRKLSNILDSLSLKSDGMENYLIKYINERFHSLVHLYISCSESISVFKESEVTMVNNNTIINHFINRHVSAWKSFEN